MDEEQIKSLSSSNHSDGHDEVEKVLAELIRQDDKKGFVSFFNSYSENDGVRSVEKKFPDCDDIMMQICSHSALSCATALLEGETGLAVDLNVPLRNGYYPLHLVTEKLHPDLTDLFLRHGARTDLPCCDKDSKYFGMLPLNVALEALRCHEFLSDWNPSISIFKLIYILCFPELQEPLKTVNLLSEKTPELEKISLSLVREGKLVELAGLLFVAWNKLIVPASDDNVDSSAIEQCVRKSLASLTDREYQLVNTGRNMELSECRKMQELMASASLMLTVFERGGELFDIYRPLCFDRENQLPNCIMHGHPSNFIFVRSTIVMLKRLGFALKREDTDLSDMSCFRVRMKSFEEEKLRGTIDRILHSRKSQISNNLGGNHLIQSPSSRAFHTCRIPRSSSISKPCNPAEAHHRMNNISSKQPNVVLSAMRGAYYGLALMKLRAK